METETSIAYLGPAGTYTDEAAHRFAERMGAQSVDYQACPSLNEVYRSVERGKTEFGVMPIENALEGAVTATLDSFAFNNDVEIVGETVLSIHHCLVMHPDADQTDIESIASHPQGLAQCRRYLAAHFPATKTVAVASTAEGARLASLDTTVAGISSRFAADIFGCQIIESGIEDHLGNQTQFVLAARAGHAPVFKQESLKTSLALFLDSDRPGALLMILSEFAYAGLNLTKIQSRPTKRALGDYMFFMDVEGSPRDPDMQTALNCLRLKLRDVKVLGSYPLV